MAKLVLVCVGAASALTLHDFSAKTIAGVETPLSSFAGKPALVVNVASL